MLSKSKTEIGLKHINFLNSTRIQNHNKMKKLIVVLFALFLVYSVQAQKFVWDKLNSGISTGTLYDIKFRNSSLGMAVGNDNSTNYVLKTTDGGNNWTNMATTDINQMVRACAFVDDTTIYVIGRKGGLFNTMDGGQSWAKINLGTNVDLIDISVPDRNSGYICTKGGRYIYYTGTAWATKTVNTVDDFVAVGFPSKNDGFLTAHNGRVWRTTDGGTNWDTVKTDLENTLGSYFFAYNVGYVVGSGGMAKRTINGGVTWSDTFIYPDGFSHIDFRAVYFPQANFGFIGGDSGLILRTSDGGSNWIREFTNLDEKIYKISAPSLTIAYAAGENGIILKRRDASSLDEQSVDRFKLFPNPAHTTLFIEYPFNIQSQLTIYNVNGKEVFKTLPANRLIHSIDISRFAVGMYLVKLVSNQDISWKKVLIR